MGDTRVGAPVKRNIMHAPARRNIWALVRPYTRPRQLFLFRQPYPRPRRRLAVGPFVSSSSSLASSPAVPSFLPRLDSVNPP